MNRRVKCVYQLAYAARYVRNEGYSLDDAFDELLRWASTDDADR